VNRDSAPANVWATRFGGVALGLAVTFALAEQLTRQLHLTPRVQVVRPHATPVDAHRGPTLSHGHPVWQERGSTPRRNSACASQGGSTDLLFLGSSITFGTGFEPHQVFAHHLQTALGDPGGRCVLNWAQPGYVHGSLVATAQDVVPRIQPEVVVWELWSHAHRYSMIGDTAYNLSGYRLDEAGYPGLPGVPGSVSRFLFHRSRLYWYATLTFGAADPTPPPTVADAHDEAMAVATSHGAQLLVWLPPYLDRPFAESTVAPNQPVDEVQRWAAQHHVPVLVLAESLIDDDVFALRDDPCCHYNPRGHERVAEVMAPWLEAALLRVEEP